MRAKVTETPRWKLVVGWLLPAVALVLGVIVVIRPEPEPAEVVRAYLDAVRTGDVDTAMTYVRDSDQLDLDLPLLTDTAGGDWEVIEVSQHLDDDGEDAQVRVRLGVGGRAVPFDGDPEWFPLHRKPDGTWQIDQPLAWLIVVESPLRYIDIGGARESTPQEPDRRQYLIFPGVHPTYTHSAGLVAVRPERIAVAPATGHTVPNTVALTERGEAAAGEAVRGYLDNCAAATVPSPDGCPFGVGDWLELDGLGRLDDVRNVTYQLTRYPGASFTQHSTAFLPATTGEVRVSGTATDGTGQPRRFTLDCEFAAAYVGVALHRDDRMIAFDQSPEPRGAELCPQWGY